MRLAKKLDWKGLSVLTFNLLYHCTSLQLKNFMVLNNSEPELQVKENNSTDVESGVFVRKLQSLTAKKCA
jgi:hypothetical protein